jgi:hypothetical protein
LVLAVASGLHIQTYQGLQGQDKGAFDMSDSFNSLQGSDKILKSIHGTPGIDYPVYAEVPDTKFDCTGLVEGGE